MFLFSCCTQAQSKDVYELRTKQNNQTNYTILNPLDPKAQKPIAAHTQVLKVKKSDYQQLLKLYKNSTMMWQDQQFPHNSFSFGQIEGIQSAQWKRLSSIISNPVLFDGRIQPQDVVQGSLGDCYFLSALSSLAEKQDRITSIFGEQPGAKYGIYKVTLRINGVIEQILVDDYVPVNKKGQPLFCQPNKQQIWVPILQKAWAKANGSYANIVAGSPVQIFRAATYAPAQTIETGDKQQNQSLWRIILQKARLDRPCCCGTDDSKDINWTALNLVPGHAYTLIDASVLQTRNGSIARILKLRNPWGNTEWSGEGCESDSKFWANIFPGQAKSSFLKDFSINNDGIFYILFSDYCRYFSQTHISHMQEQGNYLYQNYSPHKKRGVHWSLVVFQEGEYWLQLHQGSRRESMDESTIARSTIILARNRQPQGYEMISGVLAHFKPDCSLRAWLTPGTYTVFSKFDANKHQIMPSDASISVYSLYYAILDRADSPHPRAMLTECFLQHARRNKRSRYEQDTLWISYKMMYSEGGYAYICFGCEPNSKHQWEVTFNERDFLQQHFKLKKPYKGKGSNQVFKVGPGQQKIIIVRVLNDNPTNLKFPPKITHKILPLH